MGRAGFGKALVLEGPRDLGDRPLRKSFPEGASLMPARSPVGPPRLVDRCDEARPLEVVGTTTLAGESLDERSDRFEAAAVVVGSVGAA